MKSILIVDDDPSYLSMMELILCMEGFEVRIAPDAVSGLAMLRTKRPDLILCDIMMPDIDGHMLLETLRREHAFADIPFIFVTAMGERTDVRKGMAEGADDYLPKPFSADELLAAVTGRIQRHLLISKHTGNTASLKDQVMLRQKITKREREVLLMVGRGATSREIAVRMGIALKTVEVHRSNLMKKLETANAASLARWAIIAEQMTADS